MRECYCGGKSCGHNIGDLLCFREWTIEPIRKLGNGMFAVGGQVITETSLKQQRGYAQHECGRWSRPKNHSSENSVN